MVRAAVASTCVAASCALVVLAVPAQAVTVVRGGVVTRQDVPSQPGSEPDTVVEPHVAVSPVNPDVAIAAAHDGRYTDTGAVAITVSWTADAGAHWHHSPAPGLTTATGGSYSRATDPVVAFTANGTAYLDALLEDPATCRTATVLLRSTDGGRTWSAPLYSHRSSTCDFSDDKPWIAIDNNTSSPHAGRIYQFFTPFIVTSGVFSGTPQVVTFSDDGGVTWSKLHYLVAKTHFTQNSQPMIRADGTVVDLYYDNGPSGPPPDRPPLRTAGLVATDTSPIYAKTSVDGGLNWSAAVLVADNAHAAADGVRCCLFAADIDATTQRMHVAFFRSTDGVTDPVFTSHSDNGVTWSVPVQATQGDVSGVQRVNVDVAARDGSVFVTYGTRTRPDLSGGYVQQQISTSGDGGATFGAPLSIGPRSVLKYAAQSRGYFPGDYIGLAVTAGRLYAVWAVSSKPPKTSTSPYHQVIYGATLTP